LPCVALALTRIKSPFMRKTSAPEASKRELKPQLPKTIYIGLGFVE
jgi:hypothetical protein